MSGDSEPEPESRPYPYLEKPRLRSIEPIDLVCLGPLKSLPEKWSEFYSSQTPPWPPTLLYGHRWTEPIAKRFEGINTGAWRAYVVDKKGQDWVRIVWASMTGPKGIAKTAPSKILEPLRGYEDGMEYFFLSSSHPMAHHWCYFMPPHQEERTDGVDRVIPVPKFAEPTQEEIDADGMEIDPAAIAAEQRLAAEAKARLKKTTGPTTLATQSAEKQRG